jgi:P22 coat protein - gene protein 5
MSQQVLLTPTIITKESLVILENNLVAANRVNRKFENQFIKIGSSLTIRKPNRFLITSGPGLQIQNINEPSVSITISTQNQISWQFTSQDLTLTVEEFSERYLKPAMATMANQIDFSVLTQTLSFSNYVGTPTVVPAAFSTSVQLVGRRMDDNAAPQDNRTLCLNPAGYWALAGGQVGLFVMPTAKDALVKGYLATIGNFEVYMDQNIQSLPSNAQHNTSQSAVITTAAGAGTTTSIFGGGSTAEIYQVGEVFTVAGVNAINPQSRVNTGVLKNFTLTASTAAGASTTILTFTPAIVTSGPYQNVTGAMSTGSAVTWLTGTTSAQINNAQDAAWTRDAIGLVTVPMEIPQGVDFAARETYRNISMRVVRAYDIKPAANDDFYEVEQAA